MATSTLLLRHDLLASPALRTGFALAVTVAVFYPLCALAWLAAPGPFLAFMNAVFHGIDFSPLVHPAGFSWSEFSIALSVMFIWSFLAGAFFGWLRQLLDS